MNTIFKPKTEKELGDTYHEMKQKTDEFMTKIFMDLHEDSTFQHLYKNSKGEWMFHYEFNSLNILRVSRTRVFKYFKNKTDLSDNNIKMLFNIWLKKNTNWPEFDAIWDINTF